MWKSSGSQSASDVFDNTVCLRWAFVVLSGSYGAPTLSYAPMLTAADYQMQLIFVLQQAWNVIPIIAIQRPVRSMPRRRPQACLRLADTDDIDSSSVISNVNNMCAMQRNCSALVLSRVHYVLQSISASMSLIAWKTDVNEIQKVSLYISWKVRDAEFLPLGIMHRCNAFSVDTVRDR